MAERLQKVQQSDRNRSSRSKSKNEIFNLIVSDGKRAILLQTQVNWKTSNLR
jgi:hypothetical protein